MMIRRLFVLSLILAAGSVHPALAARDAAFMAPSAAAVSKVGTDEAVTIEPKPDVDAGETPINVGRRATFFFVNQTVQPIDIEKISANGDSNVKADIVSDDCSKGKTIPASSRCSVTIEATPTGSGSWSAELLMTHNGAGRIARARVTGTTKSAAADKREMGLALSNRDIKPVDFGDVEVGTSKAVRSALMVNDSNEIISILSIEVIAPDNGLEKLEQGCEIDMDLKMGESCPVTLVWKPEHKGTISTDLIIRHSGRLGFAVIPIRGLAKEPVIKEGTIPATATDKSSASGYVTGPSQASGGKGKYPSPPTAQELEGMVNSGAIPPISVGDLPSGSTASSGYSAPQSDSISGYHLIGTIGNRALIYKPDGATEVVAIGEEVEVTENSKFKMVNVASREAEILYQGKKKILKLESVSALTERAAQLKQDEDKNKPVIKPSSSKQKSSEKDAKKGNLENEKPGSSVPLPLPMGK